MRIERSVRLPSWKCVSGVTGVSVCVCVCVCVPVCALFVCCTYLYPVLNLMDRRSFEIIKHTVRVSLSLKFRHQTGRPKNEGL